MFYTSSYVVRNSFRGRRQYSCKNRDMQIIGNHQRNKSQVTTASKKGVKV